MTPFKCSVCNKKSFVIITCRCGHVFCVKHRYPEDHMCNTNYIELGQQQLTKANPVIEFKKINKI